MFILMPFQIYYIVYTFFRASASPGDNIIHEATAPKSNMRAYIMRDDVEFLHDGHAAQHKEHAVLPQQQAS